ncbi:hypothetical protein ERN12_15055 [Rhodobacteraceae bacterium]|nr:hypothetical protein ERN12_15055 [Paracoccaceae bacterium]
MQVDQPDVNDIDTSTLSDHSLMYLGYQNPHLITQSARDAFLDGDPAPLLAEAQANRMQIFQGALHDAYQGYLSISRALEDHQLSPRRIIDIGCGQGLINLFFLAEFDSASILIDIEDSAGQSRFWSKTGSGHASLDAAGAFLRANGLRQLRKINPVKSPQHLDGLYGDLVISTRSCGFSYPVGMYLPIFLQTLQSGGAVVLDLLSAYGDAPDAGLTALLDQTELTELPCPHPRATRILFTAA